MAKFTHFLCRMQSLGRVQLPYKADTEMMDKKKIKVVKRIDAVAQKTRKHKKASPRQTARQIVSTVSDWVGDLKTRKSEETKAAIELLFSATRRPSES